MARYEYQATNAAGDAVSGFAEAPSVSQAVMQLEASGLVIRSIRLASEESQTGDSPVASRGNLEDRHRAVLRESLAAALERSERLLPALRALASELPAGLRKRKLLALLHVIERRDAQAAAESFPALAEYWVPLLGPARADDAPK